MAPVPSGRRALTRFQRASSLPGPLSLFTAELFTGRTHQIRVHFSAHGFPLAGDALYASANRAARKAREEGLKALRKSCPQAAAALDALAARGRQFLHAAHLGFVHPVSGERMDFDSPLPAGLEEIVVALAACRKK
jgi:23S rRNA pseudouridine1911/1915/1917 synthase